MRFPLSVKEKMHLYPPPTREVQFGSDEDEIVVTTRDFLEMNNYICNGVLPLFAGYFQ
jgi:hypothetical protein